MSWVRFDEDGRSASGKTAIWTVASTADKGEQQEQYVGLGKVKWFGAWRRYCFFPAEQTVFEQDCLRDIANFCEQQTKKRRAAQSEDGEHR